MASVLATGWVKPARQIVGLDPLGSQAPCIAVYSKLLPGITNVTDRARYYTFYPWLVWALHEDGCTSGDQFIDLFRRGDCLFTLIAHRHQHVQGDDSDEHTAALIGSNNLRSALERLRGGQAVSLKNVAAREGSGIYFKNRLGGLGQYYFGPLRDISVLSSGGDGGVVCEGDLGVAFAKGMDGAVDRDLFLSTIKRDSVRGDELDELTGFCPCRLRSSPNEQERLADFLGSRGDLEDPEQADRRLTVRLALHLAEALSSQGSTLDEHAFRGIAYSGALCDGSPLNLPEAVERQREKWGVYEGCDLLSVACLGLFWCLLHLYETGRHRMESSAGIGNWFAERSEISYVLDEVATGLVGDAADVVANRMPPLRAWTEEDHELGLANAIVGLTHGEETAGACDEVVRLSTTLLLALIARGPRGAVVSGLLPPGYGAYYPITLAGLRRHEGETWQGLTVRGLVGWIAANWLVDNHTHVAMRKLAAQSEDTFRIRWGDFGYEVVQISPAVPTSPRFRQLLRVLLDIGVLIERGGAFAVAPEFSWLKDYDGTE